MAGENKGIDLKALLAGLSKEDLLKMVSETVSSEDLKAVKKLQKGPAKLELANAALAAFDQKRLNGFKSVTTDEGYTFVKGDDGTWSAKAGRGAKSGSAKASDEPLTERPEGESGKVYDVMVKWNAAHKGSERTITRGVLAGVQWRAQKGKGKEDGPEAMYRKVMAKKSGK